MSLRPNRLPTLLLTLAGLVALAPPAAASDAKRPPNVLVILADDLGYADVGFQGCKDIPTPNLDALAKRGVRCTSGYVSHSFCSPTRAGLLTGRYQQRFGHENNPKWLPEDESVGLPLDQTTIAQVLRRASYVTGAVGKWHLGAHPRFHPNARGFDEYFGLLGGGHKYFPGPVAKSEYAIPMDRNGKKEPLQEYLTDALGKEASAFVTRHRERPWFLYLAFNAPHTPLEAPQKYLDRVSHINDEKRQKYAGLVVGLDEAIGMVLRTLRELGLEDDTLVIFASDNGGPVLVTNSSNAPLRGQKGQLYEGGVRVPFLVVWPGRLPAGRDYPHPVSTLDVLPTAAAVAGAAIPQGLKLDGVNLLPHLEGKQTGPPHERLLWRTGGGAWLAVREGDWKWLRQKGQPAELYHLGKDIGETNNVIAEHPDVAGRLEQAVIAWNGELLAPRWESPRPAKKKPAK